MRVGTLISPQMALALLLASSTARAALPNRGLVLHLDASAFTRNHASRSSVVVVWNDLSRKGHDVRQTDPHQQPHLSPHAGNGKPAVVFSGRECLDGPAVLPAGAKSLTYVAVWKRDAFDGSQAILEQSSPGVGRRASMLTVDRAYGFNGESNDQHNLLPFQPGRLAVSILRLAPGGKVTLFHNGYPAGRPVDAGKQNTGDEKFRVGAKIWGGGERLVGSIAEIMVYDRALDDDEVAAITKMLVRKWRVQVEKQNPELAAYQEMIRQNAANPNRYTEPNRPQYHFTPIEGWMNDPNGLVYFQGLCHLILPARCRGGR